MRSIGIAALVITSACGSITRRGTKPERTPPRTEPSATEAPSAVASEVASPHIAGLPVVAPVVDYVLGRTSCVVEQSGKVACWGRDLSSPVAHRNARYLEGINDAIAVEGYGANTVRIAHRDGRLTLLPTGETIPISGVALLRGHCAIDTAKALWCSTTPSSAERVDGIVGVVDMANGEHHNCYALANGTVQCVGSNGYGQLGIDSGAKQAVADMAPSGPTGFHEVPGLTRATAVAAGADHSCALLSSGHVECWGSGYQGNTGPGRPPKRGKRVRIAGIDDAQAIAAAPYGWTTCAIRAGGRISCWGMSGAWSDRAEHEVINLPPVSSPRRMRVSRAMVCVIDGSGTLVCLGNPPLRAPVAIPGISGARQVIANDDQSCARLDNGDVLCWGRFEQRAGGDQVSTRFEVEPQKMLSGATDIAGGYSGARLADFCVTTARGSVACHRTPDPFPGDLPGFRNAVQVAMGQWHVCARTRAGRVQCWGSNDHFQLGHPDPHRDSSNTVKAITVAHLPRASQLAAGRDTTCAIAAADGRVFCWGEASLLGDGSGARDHRHRPKPVPGLRALDIAMSFDHTCVVDQNHQVHCWGTNLDGGTGAPTGGSGYRGHIDTPFAVDIHDAVSLWLGGPSCAMRQGGRLTCWSRTSMPIRRALAAAPEEGFYDWPFVGPRSVALAREHACLALADGRVQCLGSDEYAAVGSGARSRWIEMVRLRGQ